VSVSLISTDSAPLASRGLPDQGQGIRTRKYEKTFVHMLAYNFIDTARSSSLFVKSETTAFERFTSGNLPEKSPRKSEQNHKHDLLTVNQLLCGSPTDRI
jgi:hypothetical protein